jgi:hypothetical protein
MDSAGALEVSVALRGAMSTSGRESFDTDECENATAVAGNAADDDPALGCALINGVLLAAPLWGLIGFVTWLLL